MSTVTDKKDIRCGDVVYLNSKPARWGKVLSIRTELDGYDCVDGRRAEWTVYHFTVNMLHMKHPKVIESPNFDKLEDLIAYQMKPLEKYREYIEIANQLQEA